MAEAGLHRTIPALPVREMGAAVAFYRERFGFSVLHHDGGFAVLGRDDAVLHLWEAGDRGGVAATDFGTREFATLDLDGNLLSFFRWESASAPS
jgi:catechol 2,3-dioxygenase-like lactoylglutathione lyase family enzyme